MENDIDAVIESFRNRVPLLKVEAAAMLELAGLFTIAAQTLEESLELRSPALIDLHVATVKAISRKFTELTVRATMMNYDFDIRNVQ